jgi:hypothetical protein
MNATADAAPPETDPKEARSRRADAEQKIAAYEVLRDELIEQLIHVDLTGSTRKARADAKVACARARLVGEDVRTPDSIAVILSSRSGAEGRDAILELQRNLYYDL